MGRLLITASAFGWLGILVVFLLPGSAAQEEPAATTWEYATVEIDQPAGAPQIVRIELNDGAKHRTNDLFLSQKDPAIQARWRQVLPGYPVPAKFTMHSIITALSLKGWVLDQHAAISVREEPTLPVKVGREHFLTFRRAVRKR